MRRPGVELLVIAGLLVGYGAYWNFAHPPAAPAAGSMAAVRLDPALLSDSDTAEARWQREFEAARQAYERGNAAGAKPALTRALELASQAGPDATHQTLAALADVTRSQGAYGAAAKYYLQAIGAASSLPAPGRDATVAYYQTGYAKASRAAGEDPATARQALATAGQLYGRAYAAGSPELEHATARLRQAYLDIGDREGAARLVNDG